MFSTPVLFSLFDEARVQKDNGFKWKSKSTAKSILSGNQNTQQQRQQNNYQVEIQIHSSNEFRKITTITL